MSVINRPTPIYRYIISGSENIRGHNNSFFCMIASKLIGDMRWK